jgi:predicted AAA+ superfamily ATPase
VPKVNISKLKRELASRHLYDGARGRLKMPRTAFGEIEKQVSAHPERISLHHLRDKDGYEFWHRGAARPHHAGVEVKAASSVREGDLRGLKRLRELLGSRFRSGIVLYDGEHVLPFGERLLAVPLSSLWVRSPRSAATASQSK